MFYFLLLFSYLFGSISFAVIISKIMRLDDPRHYGSRNAGATNVMRTGNKCAAALTLIGDMVKGLIVVLAVKYFSKNIAEKDILVAISGVLVVVGHIYPIFFGFKGGKGVATASGVIFGVNIYLFLLVIATWLLVFKISKTSSLSALAATILCPIYAYIVMGNKAYFWAILVISSVVLCKHKSNIIRILRGQEDKFKLGEKIAAKQQDF